MEPRGVRGGTYEGRGRVASIGDTLARDNANVKGSDGNVSLFRYKPPTLAEFVSDIDYLGYPALSPVQFHDAIQVIGPDPEKIFSNGSFFRLGVFLWGKGGGKDWTCAILCAYFIQILLCMKDPHKFFGMTDKSYIDVLNVSLSEEHAIGIYWEYFKTAIKNNRWLTQHYALYEGNHLVGGDPANPKIKLTAGAMVFDEPRIRARAYGADNESAEGGNPVVWLMDEADAFKTHTKIGNAKKIYSTLRSSAATRYGTKWKGFIISYPRSEDGFAVKMYNESQKKAETEEGDTIYGSRHATWEVLPKDKFSSKTFEFLGMNIPVDFLDDFTKYPEESMAKIACIPPKVESAFFSFRERILECVKPNKAPVFRTQDTDIVHTMEGTGEKKKYVGKSVFFVKDLSWSTIHTPRVVSVDGGLTNNRAALIMAHGEPTEIQIFNQAGAAESTFVNKVVVDAIIVWQPDKRKGLQVSLSNIESLIIELKKDYRFNIVRVSYDQWNSQTSIENLQSRGIVAEEHTVTDKDYFELRSMVYSGGVELLPPTYYEGDALMQNEEAELLLEELQRLQLLNGKKVDHPPESENGCFSGDTKVALLSGDDVPIEEVVDMVERKKSVWVYSIDPVLGIIVPKKVTKAFRNGIKRMVEVTLDNGEKIRCTPNHRFMLRDGSYKEAKGLIHGQSLVMNHKVTGVRWVNCGYTYDIQVDGTHNYALASGVFVHNSKDVADCLASVNRLLNHVDEKRKVMGSLPRGILGPGFTRSSSSPFSPAAQGVQGDLSGIPGMPKSPTPLGGLSPGQPLYTKQLNRPNPLNDAPRLFPRPILSTGTGGGGRLPGAAGQSTVPPHLR